ncbi:hypothetical protein TSAR_015430 [Trichomalopsis sarcophagae]|uniref:RING-type domain-containing protein n=1 Tax=Trichomalopsis sarcophagae TaxID=543379 RepID=A0A232FHT8_9HYME|nr:hypothetical protein TSAR_015430 [Trichomalopsis sarcophagae]
MQLKHFKKTFIMNNEWSKTCKALKGLLDILVCSKCHNNLYNPEQFLGCGHFSCISCLKNNSASCNECQLPNENKDTMKDIQRIAEACSIIANEIGYKHNIENLETRPQLPSVHNGGNGTDSSIPKTKQDKQNKRKGGTYSINDHLKKTKWDKPATPFRIPKNIDKRNGVGETRLQVECKRGNIKNVEDLLKAGADPNVTCHAGWTALQETSDFHHYAIVEILLKYKADINKPGHEGRTALHEAVKNQDVKMVKLLLKNGAKINIKDGNNKTPIDYCVSDEIKLLLDPNNEESDKTVRIPELIENGISNNRPKSRIQNRVCEKDIIDTNGSANKNPKNRNVTSSRRITRHSICQDINKEGARKKSITDYFPSIDQPGTSKVNNYDSFPRNSEKVIEKQSAISSSSPHSKPCVEDPQKNLLKKSTSKNIQNDCCEKAVTKTLANVNVAKSQQNFPQARTSKITYSKYQTNHKNDSNDKKGLKSKFCSKNDDSDSDIELVFEAKSDQAEVCSITLIKDEDHLKNDTIYVKTNEKDCISSQGSIDVVNTSSFIATEDAIIDVEN